MPIYHSAIHGNSFVPQQMASGYLENVNGKPFTDVTGLATAFGKTFTLGNNTDDYRLFYGSFGLMGYIADQRPAIEKLYFYFKTGSAAVVRGIKLYDYQRELWRWPRRHDPTGVTELTGDWSYPRTDNDGVLHSSNIFDVWHYNPGSDIGIPIQIYSALTIEISVLGSSSFNGGAAESYITFVSAGLNLII